MKNTPQVQAFGQVFLHFEFKINLMGKIPSDKEFMRSMPPGTYKTNGALLTNGNSLADCASIPFLMVHIFE